MLNCGLKVARVVVTRAPLNVHEELFQVRAAFPDNPEGLGLHQPRQMPSVAVVQEEGHDGPVARGGEQLQLLRGELLEPRPFDIGWDAVPLVLDIDAISRHVEPRTVVVGEQLTCPWEVPLARGRWALLTIEWHASLRRLSCISSVGGGYPHPVALESCER